MFFLLRLYQELCSNNLNLFMKQPVSNLASIYRVTNFIWNLDKDELKSIGMTDHHGFIYHCEINRPILDPIAYRFNIINYYRVVSIYILPRALNYINFLLNEASLNDANIIQMNRFVFDFILDIGEDLEPLIENIYWYINY